MGGGMVPRTLELHPSTLKRLVRLTKEAGRDGSYRVAKRLQAIVMNAEGYSSGEIARILKAPRSKTSEWLRLYEEHGVDGLLEGHRSGRPRGLDDKERQTTRRYSRQRSSGVWLGHRHLDIADDLVGH